MHSLKLVWLTKHNLKRTNVAILSFGNGNQLRNQGSTVWDLPLKTVSSATSQNSQWASVECLEWKLFKGWHTSHARLCHHPYPVFFLFIAAIFHITGKTCHTLSLYPTKPMETWWTSTASGQDSGLTITPWCHSLWRDIKAATDPKYMLWCIQTTYCGHKLQKHLSSPSATIRVKQIQYHLGMGAGYLHV